MKLLQQFGISCEVASNGEIAVAALKRKFFPLVFMDCQMPVMDGYEATAFVRKLQENSPEKSVIVALTAEAMEGGKEQKCCSSEFSQ